MKEIIFDFAGAFRAKQKLEEIEARMNAKVEAGYEETLHELSEAWQGEAGAEFKKLADREAVKLHETAEHLRYAQRCVEEALKTARETEEKIKEIAQVRTYEN